MYIHAHVKCALHIVSPNQDCSFLQILRIIINSSHLCCIAFSITIMIIFACFIFYLLCFCFSNTVCGENKFGWNCEHECGVSVGVESCIGSQLCMPDPVGCSCMTGLGGTSCSEGKSRFRQGELC